MLKTSNISIEDNQITFETEEKFMKKLQMRKVILLITYSKDKYCYCCWLL